MFDEPVLRLTSVQEVPPKKEEQAAASREFAPLPEWIDKEAPAEPTPPRPLAPSRPDVEEPASLSPLTEGRIAAMKRGQLVHALLEILPDYDDSNRLKAENGWPVCRCRKRMEMNGKKSSAPSFRY